MHDYNLKLNGTARAILLQKLWLDENRGVLTQVAKQLRPPVTPQAVQAVYAGIRRSSRIERALRRRGAPIGTSNQH